MTRVVLVPGVLALLPEYAGRNDPVADLRAAALAAVAWLGPAPRVVASAQGERVAAYLLGNVGTTASLGAPGGVLVVGNGSATRTPQAPGHLDDRAAAYDQELGHALRMPDPAALASLDIILGEELWADVRGLVALGGLLGVGHRAQVDYDDDPFGVQYWVIRWDDER